MIDAVYGTFASIKDYQAGLVKTLGLEEIFTRLRSYYDTNFLSCIFAPLFPAQSRNCLWELRKSQAPYNERLIDAYCGGSKFKPLSECQEPWGSSSLWKEMAR
jgi:hypothetical protein